MRRFLRIFFSRYAISLLIILADLSLIAYFIFYFSIYSLYFFLFAAAVDFAVFLRIVNRDVNPEVKLTWLVVVMAIPLFGCALYLIFNSRSLKKKESGLMTRVFDSLNTDTSRETESNAALRTLAEKSGLLAGYAHAILGDDPLAELYREEKTEYFSSGEKFYTSLLAALDSAQRYIFIETFILSEGKMWNGIYDVLKRKVKEGVDVRLLYDDIGSIYGVGAHFDRELCREGIKCHRFGRITPRLVATHNNRDHRKITVVDGTVAFTGGVNISDEYINLAERFGHWKDGGIRIEGSAAGGFAKLFLSLWCYTEGGTDFSKELLPPRAQGAPALTERSTTAPRSKARASADTIGEYGRGLGEKAAKSAHVDGTQHEEGVREDEHRGGFIIPFGSGPSPIYPRPVCKNLIMGMINGAESFLYVTTPYLIIDYDITEALRSAAARGVDVRIITPGIPDKKMVNVMTKSSYPRLIESGVRIFEYTLGFIHEKCIIKDGEVATVGTVNLDYRSLIHHYECGAWLAKCPVITDVLNGFLDTLERSTEITAETARLGILAKLAKSLVRIFAPLM